MEVKLLTSTTSIKDMEQFAAIAALTCHGNADKEFVASEVLKRIIKAGHESVLEHITLTYSVKGLSRACLQEVARHRHISLSVESTRHTLHKNVLRNIDNEFEIYCPIDIVYTQKCTIGDKAFPTLGEFCVGLIRDMAERYTDLSNDCMKYYLPEFWPTNLILTSNIRELRHIIKLRTAPAALKEFQELAHKLYDTVPEEYRYLLADCVYKFAPQEEVLGVEPADAAAFAERN